MEGVVFGIPAIAASQDENGDHRGDVDFAANLVADLARRVLVEGLPINCLLNVNFPALPPAEVRGIQITRLGRRIYRDVLIERHDPKGRPYYWIGGEPPTGEPEPGTDIGALARGLRLGDTAELGPDRSGPDEEPGQLDPTRVESQGCGSIYERRRELQTFPRR